MPKSFLKHYHTRLIVKIVTILRKISQTNNRNEENLKGKNLILSSGAENLFMKRNHEDVIIILEKIVGSNEIWDTGGNGKPKK